MGTKGALRFPERADEPRVQPTQEDGMTEAPSHSTEPTDADATRTPEQRKSALARAVANSVREGWGVQSQTDYQAVLAKGHRPNHVLHLILTLITLGLWLVVWIPLAFLQKERHRVIDVDEYGNVNVQG